MYVLIDTASGDPQFTYVYGSYVYSTDALNDAERAGHGDRLDDTLFVRPIEPNMPVVDADGNY